ncbi:MAG: nuclear transport factor 2 family protein [Burkholderiales bacterium]
MTSQRLGDRPAIVDAVANWALWRDSGRWDELASLYAPDAIQHTTWFVGPAAEFIRLARSRPPGGSLSQHFVGACAVALNGERAIAETRLVLLVRGTLLGVEVDITCYCRSYDRFVREAAAWRIARREMIYEKDRIDPLTPGAELVLDGAELARYPVGYRHLAYFQAAAGARITPGLPTPGSEALARLYAEGERWLRG